MKRALVALDYSETSRSLIPYAFQYARKTEIDHLDFIHVLEKAVVAVAGYTVDLPRETREVAYKKLLAMIEEGQKKSGVDDIPYDVILEFGNPCENIVIRAEETACDIVLIGHRGMSDLKRFFLGSVAARVVRHSPCTVLIYHPHKGKAPSL